MQISYIKYNNPKSDCIKNQAIKEINKFSDPKKRAMFCTCLITIALTNLNTLQAKEINIGNFKRNVDSKGTQVLLLAQTIGYWVAIVCAAVEIIWEIKKQNIAGILAIALKYATMYGLLYGLPWMFDLIKSLFEEA